ncbi:ribokinase [Marinicrinis lubricantis]|uniref:Ribokinase n=1 Tax=Marinicrinis lubricantis TaxID=2086470 RepID=A0ABW1IQ73_9BACL
MTPHRPRISVVGSLNMDLVVSTGRMPTVGETIQGSAIHYIPGGKGANQAVGCARLGAEVSMIGAVGDDAFGQEIIRRMKEKGVEMNHVTIQKGVPTGTATILHLPDDNCIVVVPGANGSVTTEMVEEARDIIETADVLLVQLEIPLQAVERALSIAKKAGVLTVLNPAPAQLLYDSILRLADYMTPNETEFAILSGDRSIEHMDLTTVLSRWQTAHHHKLIVTRGSEGVSYLSEGQLKHVPAPKVKPVDTVGAGDCFNAAFGFAMACGYTIDKALKFAVKAASISVTRFGAQDSMPTIEEVGES